jgi:hypothetical protein
MPLVFVHGVNTRDSDGHRDSVAKRANLFARVALRGLAENPSITDPYWGGDAARPAWGNASVPDGDYESFGIDDQTAVLVLEATGGIEDENPLLRLARRSLPEAVDLLWTLIPEDRSDAEVAELGAKTVAYAESHPAPGWLAEVSNDAQFLTRLELEVDAWDPAVVSPGEPDTWESFGVAEVWDRVREGAGRLLGLPGRAAGSVAIAAARAKIHGTLSLFIGDILVYLNRRTTADGSPGAIPSIVISALEEARAAVTPADPHVVAVGHSMGGNILYDALTHYRPDLRLDALVTVGSQVGVFEELKLFKASRSDIPSRTAPKVRTPPNVGHWINVFDRQDLLSFAGAAVFDPVLDFEYSTGATVFGAHTRYFERPSFHRRLNERLTDVLAP